LTRLEQAKRESGGKRQGAFVILLTDGSNNRGSLEPVQAAELAKSRGIPVYTIGAAKEGIVPFPVFDDKGRKLGYRRVMSDLDEGALREISKITGGHFYRADDLKTAESAFKAIDKAQKIEFQAKSYLITTELFLWPATPGLVALILAALLSVARSRANAASVATTRNTVPAGRVVSSMS
jgi:Ca-activated chloride channel family protein